MTSDIKEIRKPRVRLIIAGGRDFNDYSLLESKINYFLSNTDLTTVTIISGTARGADLLGERYAKEHSIPVERYPANWDKHGRAAGHIRNKQMAQVATHCTCFWDGKSRGTKSMIDLAKQHKLNLRVVNY